MNRRELLGTRHADLDQALPRDACDCHVHVFGPPGRYAFAENRTFMPSPVTLEDLLCFHGLLGVDRAVIIQASPQGTDNTCLVDTLEALHGLGRQARGVAVVDETATDEQLQALHLAGVRGVRLNLQTFGISSPRLASDRLRATARIAQTMNWHVQLYAGLAVVEALADLIAGLPVPVVVDHYGLAHAAGGTQQPGFSTLLALVRQGSVHVKLSAPYRIGDASRGIDGREIARALIDSNINGMLWGTDWPHTHPRQGVPRPRHEPEPLERIDDGAQVNLFTQWTSARERDTIMVTNPARLYDFPASDHGERSPPLCPPCAKHPD